MGTLNAADQPAFRSQATKNRMDQINSKINLANLVGDRLAERVSPISKAEKRKVNKAKNQPQY